MTDLRLALIANIAFFIPTQPMPIEVTTTPEVRNPIGDAAEL